MRTRSGSERRGGEAERRHLELPVLPGDRHHRLPEARGEGRPVARDVRAKRARRRVRGVSAGVVEWKTRPTSKRRRTVLPRRDACGTPVGVRDADEVYHFFNAFPTNA